MLDANVGPIYNSLLVVLFTGCCYYLQTTRLQDEGSVPEASEACRDVSEACVQEGRAHVREGRKL